MSFITISAIYNSDLRPSYHKYLDNEDNMPFFLSQAGLWYYFAFDGQKYNLCMISKTDLGEKK